MLAESCLLLVLEYSLSGFEGVVSLRVVVK